MLNYDNPPPFFLVYHSLHLFLQIIIALQGLPELVEKHVSSDFLLILLIFQQKQFIVNAAATHGLKLEYCFKFLHIQRVCIKLISV